MMIFKRFRYYNWEYNYPSNIFEYMFSPTTIGLRIVNFIFQKFFLINGKFKFMIHFTSIVSGNIIFGKNVASSFANSSCCYIQGINGIEIGDNTIFAPGVKIISANHDTYDYSIHNISSGKVIIGKNCWLGTNVVILPGVVLGDNVVVGAGAVVTKSFPSNTIIAGVPAKIINNKD